MYKDKDKEIREYAATLELVGIRNANLMLAIVNELKGDNIMENRKYSELLNATMKDKPLYYAKEIDSTLIEEEFNKLISRIAFGGYSGYGRSRIMEVRKSTVTDVNVIVPDKVVEVTFADGSKQKTVCADSDTFSLEQAISICITKNLIGGTNLYNKAVNDGVKVYEQKIAKTEANKVEEERIKTKKAKAAAKRAERIARRKAKEMEEQIEIQKEAIIRANREMGK